MAVLLPPAPYGSPPGSSFWNDWYEKLRTLINTGAVTVTWANINFLGSNITSIANRAHNNLQGIQGGAAGDYNHLTSAQLAAIGVGNHNSLGSIQGGTTLERYHLTSAQQAKVAALPTGINATITTAKLTTGGTSGSMTFVNGLLTAQTAAT
jgi:hypothetical protein